MSTTKTTIDARVKISAGPAAGSYGRVRSFDESTWTADVTLDDGRIAASIPMKFLEVIEEAASRTLACGPRLSTMASSFAAAWSSKPKPTQNFLRSARPHARLMREPKGACTTS